LLNKNFSSSQDNNFYSQQQQQSSSQQQQQAPSTPSSPTTVLTALSNDINGIHLNYFRPRNFYPTIMNDTYVRGFRLEIDKNLSHSQNFFKKPNRLLSTS